METSLKNIMEDNLSVQEVLGLNPLVLAFIGDAVYETFVRAHLIKTCKGYSVHKLHVSAIYYVKAHEQSDIMKILENDLTEEETRIFKRGRNSKSGTVPKNANVIEYRIATGFEAVIGYLYMTDQKDRLSEIMNIIFNLKDTKI